MVKKSKITASSKKLVVEAPRKKINTYDRDFYQWTKSQAQLLKKQDFSSLDIKNLIEEIESLGKSDRRSLLSHLVILLLHRLKREYHPSYHTKSWDDSIENAHVEIDLLLLDSPSFKRQLPKLFEKAYQYARKRASIETGLTIDTFPPACPWSLEDVL